jgi:hypothetical protein
MKKLILSFLTIAVACTVISCNDDDNTASYPLAVRMTDAPADYDEVNIDLQGVEVKGANGATVLLNVNAGVYNLLDYANGVNTLIATSVLNTAEVSQIRLILGSNNTIVVDGVSYPLETPSAEQSGLKLLVNETLTADIQNEILLDFDAHQSVVVNGNGTYKLRPVVRTIVTEVSGNIAGSVSVLGVAAVVTATSSTGVEYSSTVDANGEFQISGLSAGVYTLTITPQLPYAQVIETGIVVETGSTTQVGLITLL